MFRPRSLKPLLTLLLVAACNDGIGPDPVVQSSDGESSRSSPELNILGVSTEYATAAARSCLRLALESWAAPCQRTEIFANPAPPAQLSGTLEASFWAVRGKDRVLQIDYEYDGETYPVLEFQVPSKALHERPDGTRFSDGDSVLIDVSLDLTRLLATFEPSGLRFSNEDPAILTYWYDAAGEELIAEIESTLLALWTQEFVGDPWYPVDAEHESSETL
ncbi:MAG: hypothetical protein V3R24_00280, partial [Gemmatimonadales bacterium]